MFLGIDKGVCSNALCFMPDPDGDVAWWIVAGGVGAVAGGFTGAIISYKTTGKVNWKIDIFKEFSKDK